MSKREPSLGADCPIDVNKGYVVQVSDRVFATEAGTASMPDAKPLPTGAALREFWREQLPSGEWHVLHLLIEQHPEPVEKPTIDDKTGFKRSTRDAYLSRLVAKELVRPC
jgi:hypothetical protein